VKTLKVLIEDLQRMRVPDWIVTLFDFNVQNADINSQLQDELPDMRVDLETQSLLKRKKTMRQCHVNIAVKYPKFSAAVEPFLLAFSVSDMLESGVSYANAFPKQKNRLNSEERGDFLLNTPISS